MSELVLLKLGGSLITEKNQANTAKHDLIQRLANEIKSALDARGDDLQLIIGHGAGSFGHIQAAHYKITAGASGPESWRGFAEVAAAVARLNRIIMDALLDHGIPAIAFQPSASTRTRKQQLMYFETFALKEVLKHNLVPVVHGDVSVDAVQGMNIVSTEQLFDNLARELNPNRILLASNVDGVYAGGPKMDSDVDFFDYIDPSNWAEVETHLDGSQSADVTGGMYTKVRDMYHLTLAMPPMQAMIFSGERPENVKEVLLGRTVDFGTLIN